MIPAEKLETYRKNLRRKLSRPLTETELAQLNKAHNEATELAQRLVYQHQAQQVWLVGSVARRRPLRPNSDIDLAVEGMPSENYSKLVGDLQTESGRPVDLIRFENVRPAVKQIILSEGIILMTATDNLHHLVIALEAELEHFQQLTNDVSKSIARFPATAQINIHDLRAIALLLTEIYLGAENLMLRIAKSLDEPIPSGKAWHAELLEQFSKETPNIRPELFNQDTVSLLDEFRRFRHVVHHTYSFENSAAGRGAWGVSHHPHPPLPTCKEQSHSFDYDWQEINKLLNMAPALLAKLIRDTQTFRDFLLGALADEA